jgi:NH3-dependent NAD+ synthetase
MSEVTKLQKGQVKLLEQTMKISEEIKELKQLMLKLWRAEDMEENDGSFRWPFDKHGNLLDNVNISRRLN